MPSAPLKETPSKCECDISQAALLPYSPELATVCMEAGGMEFKKIVAIVRTQVLGDVEDRLVSMRVKGISVTRVKGYGEYTTFIHPDWRFTHARIEIYTEQSMVELIVEAILESA